MILLGGLWGCGRAGVEGGSHGHAHDDEAAGDDDHPHGHGHEEHYEHDEHGDHGHGGEAGHGHAHSEGGLRLVTHSEELELCVEVPPLVLGRESEFAAHLTWSRDWKPVAAGRVTAVFSGGGAPEERFSVDGPTQAGIFRPVAVPQHAGRRRVVLLLAVEGRELSHDLGEVTVYAVADDVAEAGRPEVEGAIPLTLEQQWELGFRAERVKARPLRRGMSVYGRVAELADAATEIRAPTAGRLMAVDAQLPGLGQRVGRDELLARLLPMVDLAGSDRASLEASREAAGARERWARGEVARLEGLVAQGAAPERRVAEARLAVEEARAARRGADRQLSRLTSGQRAEGARAASLEIRAPHDGVLRAVAVRSGTHVREGEVLFELVDPDRWVFEFDVPEIDALRLAEITGAQVALPGLDEPLELAASDRIEVPLVVDDVRHTIPLLWRMGTGRTGPGRTGPGRTGPGRTGMGAQLPGLRPGLALTARLWTSEAAEALAVPRGAIVWDAGVPVVYVAVDPEAFVRRVVELGARDGELVEVVRGLEAGEQVVVEGAYLVKLAGLKDIAPDHGHAH